MLEAHVLACLTASCEQLILIGDHLQLRPKTQVRPACAAVLLVGSCPKLLTGEWPGSKHAALGSSGASNARAQAAA